MEGDASREPLLEGGAWQGEALRDAAPHPTLVGLVLPVVAGCVVHGVEMVCYFPAVSAVALCCCSMVEPSVFSAGVCPNSVIFLRHVSLVPRLRPAKVVAHESRRVLGGGGPVQVEIPYLSLLLALQI